MLVESATRQLDPPPAPPLRPPQGGDDGAAPFASGAAHARPVRAQRRATAAAAGQRATMPARTQPFPAAQAGGETSPPPAAATSRDKMPRGRPGVDAATEARQDASPPTPARRILALRR
eukprot:scaffold3450_cov323-Prasinococcus_capsulatus_cf.AAC.9